MLFRSQVLCSYHVDTDAASRLFIGLLLLCFQSWIGALLESGDMGTTTDDRQTNPPNVRIGQLDTF